MKMKKKIDRSEDRRSDTGTRQVPIKDSAEVTRINERRHTPDRRISNIEVEWIDEEIEIN
jgi:hypothetical protein